MPVVDLYTPRIETRKRAREFNIAQAQKGFQDAASTLMDWAKNKALIDKAFMETAMKAEAQKNQNVWEEKLRQNEWLSRNINTATYVLTNFPDADPNDTLKLGLEKDISGVTGTPFQFPRDPQTGRPVIDPTTLQRMQRLGGIDPKTGGTNIEGQKLWVEANKPESNIGKLVTDYQNYVLQGGKADDQIGQGYMKQILDSKDLADPQRVIINHTIETQGYAAGFNQLLELKKAGAAGGTDVKVQLPSEQAEEKLHVAQLANGQLADIQQTWDQIVARAKKGGWGRPAVGKGAETVNNLLAWVGWDDPLVTSLQKQVSNYNQTQVRLTAGLNQTEMEMLRAQGYLLNNQVPWSQFQETLDLNKRWAATDYDTRWVQ